MCDEGDSLEISNEAVGNGKQFRKFGTLNDRSAQHESSRREISGAMGKRINNDKHLFRYKYCVKVQEPCYYPKTKA